MAVLDGGYPAWQAAGFKVDDSHVSQEEVEAGQIAAAAPRGHPKYKANKQVKPQADYDLMT